MQISQYKSQDWKIMAKKGEKESLFLRGETRAYSHDLQFTNY